MNLEHWSPFISGVLGVILVRLAFKPLARWAPRTSAQEARRVLEVSRSRMVVANWLSGSAAFACVLGYAFGYFDRHSWTGILAMFAGLGCLPLIYLQVTSQAGNAPGIRQIIAAAAWESRTPIWLHCAMYFFSIACLVLLIVTLALRLARS